MPYTKKSRLGTRLRGKLAEAYGKRGGATADLWYCYSPRMDEDVVIQSSFQCDHFVLLEADPFIKQADYSPACLVNPGSSTPFKELTAVVTLVDDSVEWRIARSLASNVDHDFKARDGRIAEAAGREGATVRYFDDKARSENGFLIMNWRRALGWMSAARNSALGSPIMMVNALTDARGKATLTEIASLGERAMQPLLIAAALRLVQSGTLHSDLETAPLSVRSVFARVGVAI